MEFVVLFIVILIIGALLGGKNLGDTFRKGCGCFVILILLLVFGSIYFFSNYYHTNENKEITEQKLSYTLTSDSDVYLKPDINSEVIGYAFEGEEFEVSEPQKFNYFYEVKLENGQNAYLLKDHFGKK